jgi:hypothetical protein
VIYISNKKWGDLRNRNHRIYKERYHNINFVFLEKETNTNGGVNKARNTRWCDLRNRNINFFYRKEKEVTTQSKGRNKVTNFWE